MAWLPGGCGRPAWRRSEDRATLIARPGEDPRSNPSTASTERVALSLHGREVGKSPDKPNRELGTLCASWFGILEPRGCHWAALEAWPFPRRNGNVAHVHSRASGLHCGETPLWGEHTPLPPQRARKEGHLSRDVEACVRLCFVTRTAQDAGRKPRNPQPPGLCQGDAGQLGPLSSPHESGCEVHVWRQKPWARRDLTARGCKSWTFYGGFKHKGPCSRWSGK